MPHIKDMQSLMKNSEKRLLGLAAQSFGVGSYWAVEPNTFKFFSLCYFFHTVKRK
jgi:hypothetical protein